MSLAARADAGDPFQPTPLPKPAAESASTAPRAADDTLYRELGGQEAIHALAVEYVKRVKADPHLGTFFEKVEPVNLGDRLAEQICVVAGGPCDYHGARMKNVHADYEIRMSDFNDVVTLLQQTMDAQHSPFSTQNKLLARLAPMHRDIVNTP
jgi:hemoglobin